MKKPSGTAEHRSRSPLKADHNVKTHNSNQTLWSDVSMSNKVLGLPNAFARRSGTTLPVAPGRINRKSTYNLRHRKPLEAPHLQDHYPRVTSTTYFSSVKESEKITCACCLTPSPPRVGVTTERSKFTQSLSPVCPVPMLPASATSQLNLSSTIPLPVQSVETQTSLSPPERGHKRRRSSGQLMTSIKRKFSNLRRSLSSDRLLARVKAEPVATHPESTWNFPMDENAPVKVNFIEKCDSGAYLIQFQRNTTTQPFGLFFHLDANGFYISRLANEQHIRACQNYLHVNDRVIAIQGVPSKFLSTEGIRGLLRGCHLVTIKVRPVSTSK